LLSRLGEALALHLLPRHCRYQLTEGLTEDEEAEMVKIWGEKCR